MPNNSKKIVIQRIPFVNNLLDGVTITSYDFEKFLKNIRFRNVNDKLRAFIYCDPPYYNTFNNYEIKWTKEDTVRLFLVLSSLNIRFAISETDSELIEFLAIHFKLNIIEICELKCHSKTRKELLITNY
jgi:DNA adenine methylase